MTLKVISDTLRSSGDRLGSLAGDATKASSYADTNLVLPASDGGIYRSIVSRTTEVQDRVDGVVAQLEKVLRSSGRELRQAAHMYDTTDRREAEEYDTDIVVTPEPDLGPK